MRSKTKRQTQTLCQGTHTVERKGQQVGQECQECQVGHGQDQGQVDLGQGHTMATPDMVMDILDMVMAIVAMGMVTQDSQDSSMGDLSHIVVLATTADSTT